MTWLRRARLTAGVLLLTLLLASCAHQLPPPAELGAGLPAKVELAETPFHPQERYQCGPAALATVLNAQGVQITPEQLVPQVYLPEREGSLQAEMIAAARRQGLLAIRIDPSLDALLAELAASHPVLVLQNLGLSWLPRWHYAVAIGYDLERGGIILRSGKERRRITPLGVFLNTWERSRHWGIVVLRPGDFPARVEAIPYLEAVSALEARGDMEAARLGYLSAGQRWPDNRYVFLGLGNTEYALGRHQAAEAALREALRVAPAEAAVWNNLAYALAGQRCVRGAREAARCASALGPGNAEIARTRQQMDNESAPPIETCLPLPPCPVP